MVNYPEHSTKHSSKYSTQLMLPFQLVGIVALDGNA